MWDTIITFLINFVLWEIFMSVDIIWISKKKFQLRQVILFTQLLVILLIQCDQNFIDDIWNNVRA